MKDKLVERSEGIKREDKAIERRYNERKKNSKWNNDGGDDVCDGDGM
ncbi:hypothetical protein [Borrelia crocidurae]|nr:hypothetical protein [Borrelia crocidurae]